MVKQKFGKTLKSLKMIQGKLIRISLLRQIFQACHKD